MQELVGFLAGAAGLSLSVPQYLRIRRLGHTEGVSLPSWALLYAFYWSWGIYGVRTNSISMTVTSALAVILTLSLIHI
jgi:uncharacterized protein with PQ loop repeat